MIAEQLREVQKDIEKLELEIKPFRESTIELVSEKDLQKKESDVKKAQLEWKRRKRGCMDIVNQISESMEMNRKDFIKKVGLDTDEENKVVCPV